MRPVTSRPCPWSEWASVAVRRYPSSGGGRNTHAIQVPRVSHWRVAARVLAVGWISRRSPEREGDVLAVDEGVGQGLQRPHEGVVPP